MSDDTSIPIDPTQCQSIRPNPKWSPFALGENSTDRARMIRCWVSQPRWVAMRVDPTDKLPAGMSLCADCKEVMERQMPVGVRYQRLAREETP